MTRELGRWTAATPSAKKSLTSGPVLLYFCEIHPDVERGTAAHDKNRIQRKYF